MNQTDSLHPGPFTRIFAKERWGSKYVPRHRGRSFGQHRASGWQFGQSQHF